MISSRTPEGSPNRCPVCGNHVWIEPSKMFGDAPCPHCGSLIWFLSLPTKTYLFSPEEADEIRERLFGRIADKLGVDKEDLMSSKSFLSDISADSLDIVEMLMDMEEELKEEDDAAS